MFFFVFFLNFLYPLFILLPVLLLTHTIPFAVTESTVIDDDDDDRDVKLQKAKKRKGKERKGKEQSVLLLSFSFFFLLPLKSLTGRE